MTTVEARNAEILARLQGGEHPKTIAAEMGISTRTVGRVAEKLTAKEEPVETVEQMDARIKAERAERGETAAHPGHGMSLAEKIAARKAELEEAAKPADERKAVEKAEREAEQARIAAANAPEIEKALEAIRDAVAREDRVKRNENIVLARTLQVRTALIAETAGLSVTATNNILNAARNGHVTRPSKPRFAQGYQAALADIAKLVEEAPADAALDAVQTWLAENLAA